MVRHRAMLISSLLLVLAACPKPTEDPEALGQTDSSVPSTTADGSASVLTPSGSVAAPEGVVVPGQEGEPALTDAERAGSRLSVEERINDAVELLASNTEASRARATRILESVVDDAPENAWGWFNLGVSYYQQDDIAQARDAWEEATRLDPTLAEAWLYQGVIQEEVGRYDLAIGAYRGGLAHDPESMKLHEALVGALRNAGRGEEAIAEAKGALKINSKSLNVYNNLGMAYMDKGELDLALFVFKKAMASIIGAEQSAYLHSNLGWAFYLKGDMGFATYHLQEAVKHDPELVPANVYLARLYLDNHNYEDMVPLLETARQQDPENHGVLMNLGIAYRGVGRMDDAKAAYERALETQPSNPDPLYNLGILQGDYLKDYDASIQAFESYIEQGGEHAEVALEFVEEVKKERKKAEKKQIAEAEKAKAKAEREERLRLIREAEEATAEQERKLAEENARRAAQGLPPLNPDGTEPEETPPGAEPEGEGAEGEASEVEVPEGEVPEGTEARPAEEGGGESPWGAPEPPPEGGPASSEDEPPVDDAPPPVEEPVEEQVEEPVDEGGAEESPWGAP